MSARGWHAQVILCIDLRARLAHSLDKLCWCAAGGPRAVAGEMPGARFTNALGKLVSVRVVGVMPTHSSAKEEDGAR